MLDQGMDMTESPFLHGILTYYSISAGLRLRMRLIRKGLAILPRSSRILRWAIENSLSVYQLRPIRGLITVLGE